MITWASGQYVPIHDHPPGGCMVKIAKGPGVKETLYQKIPAPTAAPQRQQYFCCQHRNVSGHSKNTHGCDYKHGSTEMLQELYTFDARIGNEHEVRTLIADELMHNVWNPYDKTTFMVSYYIGDYSNIVFWLPDDPEHAPKCLSRGDDEVTGVQCLSSEDDEKAKYGESLCEGCHDCSP